MRHALLFSLVLTGCGGKDRPDSVVATPAPVIPAVTPMQAIAVSPTISVAAARAEPGTTEPVPLRCITADLSHIKNLRIGMAVLEATISAEGKVEDVRIIRSHSPEVDAAFVAATRKCQYSPALYKGKPVPVFLTITLNLCG